MTDKILKVYAAHGDGGERGLGPVIGYYTSESTAKMKAKGKGWYGGDGVVREAHIIESDGEYYALVNTNPVDLNGLQAEADEKLRAETLAGLSEDQIRVLGIK